MLIRHPRQEVYLAVGTTGLRKAVDGLTAIIFNEAEATAELSASEPELITVHEHKRVRPKDKKGIDFRGLSESIIEYHLPEEEMVCSC